MTIEELLGASADSLEAMSDDQLKDYLKDITNLEPKSFGRIIIDDSCPIKSSKKRTAPSKLTKKILEDKEIEAMKKELGL